MGAMGAVMRMEHMARSCGCYRPSAGCVDGAQVRQMLALAMVLDGRPRTGAAVLNGMDRQTLRD